MLRDGVVKDICRGNQRVIDCERRWYRDICRPLPNGRGRFSIFRDALGALCFNFWRDFCYCFRDDVRIPRVFDGWRVFAPPEREKRKVSGGAREYGTA